MTVRRCRQVHSRASDAEYSFLLGLSNRFGEPVATVLRRLIRGTMRHDDPLQQKGGTGEVPLPLRTERTRHNVVQDWPAGR